MGSTIPASVRSDPGGGRGHGTPASVPFVSVAKGAGNLEAEAGGGDAAGPKAGAADAALSGGEQHRWLKGQALETGIQCPRATADPETAGKHHPAAGAGREAVPADSKAQGCY